MDTKLAAFGKNGSDRRETGTPSHWFRLVRQAFRKPMTQFKPPGHRRTQSALNHSPALPATLGKTLVPMPQCGGSLETRRRD